jgi:CDGSH-type Zn-finger protein
VVDRGIRKEAIRVRRVCFSPDGKRNDMDHPLEDPFELGERATITPYENGPLIVRGPVELRTQDGRRIEPGRKTIALCRCGRSATKPFCDGSHKAVLFRATSNSEST